MAIIKKFTSYQNLTNFNVLVDDINPNSDYFRITEFKETFTGGKNGFLIEGSPFLKETTEVKIEVLDVNGNPVYYEPGKGTPDYYEGISTLVSVHVYDDTPIGLGKITILGELKQYVDENGVTRDVPDDWKGVYNVKWEKTFQINKNLNNEDIVRFYKRPQIQITELVKPIFSKTIPTVTDTVEVTGVPENPPFDTDLTNWRAGTNYKLIRATGSWDRDVDENEITISSLNYTSNIIEVLNDREVLVDIPYTENNLVKSFVSQSASVTYSDFQNEIIGESALTGSFAKIDMSQLKTFVGDVARVKIFRKSRNTAGDFQFVQESKLESTELLRDVTTQSDNEISYGRFDDTNLSTYWETSSVLHPVSVDSSVLSQAVKVDYDISNGGVQKLITKESFTLSKDVEYTLSFRTLLNGVTTSDKYINAYFSGSYTNSLGNPTSYTQSFMHISGSSVYTTRQNVSQNILAERDIDAKLVLEFKGDDWYVSNVSLRNAQETSFSPDEFTLIQDIPRKIASETFDFRFEFYDINNNYIPVDVIASATFNGGNDFPTSGKLLTFESDRNAFRFSSGSVQNPTGQQIQFKVTQNNLTGSILFESQAFDVDGNYLDPSDYLQYPGKLTSITPAGAIVTINNFTGSRVDGLYEPFVGSVVYTASLENLQEFETVYRLEDGDNAPQLIVTSNANQFIYEPTTLSPKPSGQSITVRAQRKNLASLVTPLTVNSGSNLPPLNYVDTVNGIDTYTISALEFSASFAQNNFDEVTYSFTGSDVFGNAQYDEITLSKVINFDGVSIVLSNESVSFPAYSTGEVFGGFDESSGSVQMFIGGVEIQHDDFSSDLLRDKNTFDITSITENGVTATSTSPTNQYYSISGMSKDSGSLTLNIEYLAGDSSTSQSFQKIVSYTKSKRGTPNVEVAVTPSAQTIETNSRGSGSVIPQSLTVTALEGGTSRPFTFGNVSATNGLLFDDSTEPTIVFTSDASSITSDTSTITIPITVTDSEGTDVQKTVKATISKSRKAQPSITFSATPQAQTIDAKSTGELIGTIQDVTISGFEGNADLTYNQDANLGKGEYKITGVTGVNINPLDNPPSTSSIDIDSFSGDTAIGIATIAYKDSEDTTGTQTIKFTLSKAKNAAPTTLVSINPQAQTVPSSSEDGIGTPVNLSVSVSEGGQPYAYASSGESTFQISSTTHGTIGAGGIIDLSGETVPITGINGSVEVSYINSNGTSGTQPISFNVGVSAQGSDGANGPGVVFRGPWQDNIEYYDSDDFPTRRDAVIHNDVYYATKTNPAQNLNKEPGVETDFWEELGSDSFFVAAEIAIFRNSFIKETLNVGLNDEGVNANITIAGGRTDPYISLGQASNSQTYGDTGIFIGSNGGNQVLSLVGTGGSLLWDGDDLTIDGSGTFTGTLEVGTIKIGKDVSGTDDGIFMNTNNFWLYDGSDVSFKVGTTTENMSFSGNSLSVTGEINATAGTFTGDVLIDGGTLTVQSGNITIDGGALLGPNFSLSGTGLVASNAELSGDIYASGGTIGGFTISGDNLSTSEFLLKAGGSIQGVYLGPVSVTNGSLSPIQSVSFQPATGNIVSVGVSDTENISAQGTFNPTIPQSTGNITSAAAGAGNYGGLANVRVIVSEPAGRYVNSTIDPGQEQVTPTERRDGRVFSHQIVGNLSVTCNGVTLTRTISTLAVENESISTNMGDQVFNFNDVDLSGGITITAQLTDVGIIYDQSNFLSGDDLTYSINSPQASSTTVQFTALSGGSRFTEMCNGGLQVVSNTGKFLKVPSTNTGNAVEIGGTTYMNGQLNVNGDITATGNITAYGTISSDKRLKTNLTLLENPLNSILQLSGYTFRWNDKQTAYEPDTEDVGVVAQEVQEILPQAIREMSNGYLGVRYERLIPLLIEAVKELNNKVDTLEAELKRLK